MESIYCENCNKVICETNKTNKGAKTSDVLRNGGIAKMPVLFGINDGFHFFCCKNCWNEWFKINCKPNENADKILNNVKEELDKNIPKIVNTFDKIIKGIKQHKS